MISTGMTLATEDLGVGYGGIALLKAGTLNFAPGTVTAILGPNGVGKSTLLRTLAGLQAPVHGAITLDGRDLKTIFRGERARNLAYLAQEESAAFPMTVREAVAVGRLPHSMGLNETPADLSAIAAAVARVDLTAEIDTLLERLSGGQRRRATIARALAQEASVILLDEPLAHLDPAHMNEVLRTLHELRRLGRTVVATFHEVDAALAIADRTILLAEGAVAYAGTPDDLDDAELARTYGIGFERFTAPGGTARRPLWRIG